MAKPERWKQALLSAIAVALFIIASFDQFWGLFIKIPGIGDLFRLHPFVEGAARAVQVVCFFIVTVWQALRFIRANNGEVAEGKMLGGYGISPIPLNMGKSKRFIYIKPEEFTDDGSVRRMLVDRLSHWKKRTGDVIAVYSAHPCGKRETVCRAIPDGLYPLFHIDMSLSDSFNDVAEKIRIYAAETHCRQLSVLIHCERTLMAREVMDLHKEGEKLRTMLSLWNSKVVARLVFLCTCNETIYDSRADWAFRFENLSAVESERFLQKSSALMVKEYECPDAYALSKERFGGRQLEAAENFARGNPADLLRFLEAISFNNESPNPLDAVQNEWQKRSRHLGLEESFQKRILSVLHLLIAFYREGVHEFPLSDILQCVFKIGRATPEEAKIKTALGELLGLRGISLSPFDFRDVSLPDYFCDFFLFSCGQLDRINFHDEWQLVVGSLFTHPELKDFDYAETYCRAMVNAAIRCQLTHALPFERHPVQLYWLLDHTILRVAFSRPGPAIPKETCAEAEARRLRICALMRERCAEAVIEFMADRLEILESAEVYGMISEDIVGYAQNPGEWITRALYMVLFLSEIEPDPLCWPLIAHDANNAYVGSNFLTVLQEKIGALLEDGNVPAQIIDNAWALCWILQGLLNDIAQRPFAGGTEWNVFLGEAMSRLGTRRSSEFEKLVNVANELFKGDAYKAIDSLIPMLVQTLGVQGCVAQTVYLFLATILELQMQPENRETLFKAFISSLRRDAESDIKDRLLPALGRLLIKIEFNKAWQETYCTINANPLPKDIEELFPRLRQGMDETCAKFNMDAEKTPAFLVKVASSVVTLQARFQNNKNYQESFIKSWGQLNAAILERFYAFTERDWFAFMKTVQGQTQFLSPEIRGKYIALWESALGKIQQSVPGNIQVSSLELSMFLSTCSYVFYDSEWASRSQMHLVALAVRNQFPLCLNDHWKCHWMRNLIPMTVLANPQAAFFAMFSVAGAVGQTDDGPVLLSPGISSTCLDGLVMGIQQGLHAAQTNLSTTVEIIPDAQRTEYLSLWVVAFQSFIMPYIDYMGRSHDRKRDFVVVLSEAVTFMGELENVIDHHSCVDGEILRTVKTVRAKLLSMLEQLPSELVDAVSESSQRMFGTDSDDPQIFLKVIEHFELMPNGTLTALKIAAQKTPLLLESLDKTIDCCSDLSSEEVRHYLAEILSPLYNKVQELYSALTEEARTRGGQEWYDGLMAAFAESRAFGAASKNLAADAKKKGGGM